MLPWIFDIFILLIYHFKNDNPNWNKSKDAKNYVRYVTKKMKTVQAFLTKESINIVDKAVASLHSWPGRQGFYLKKLSFENMFKKLVECFLLIGCS